MKSIQKKWKNYRRYEHQDKIRIKLQKTKPKSGALEQTNPDEIEAFLSRVSQTPGKYQSFQVANCSDKNSVVLMLVVMALGRLREFLVERGVNEVSLPA